MHICNNTVVYSHEALNLMLFYMVDTNLFCRYGLLQLKSSGVNKGLVKKPSIFGNDSDEEVLLLSSLVHSLAHITATKLFTSFILCSLFAMTPMGSMHNNNRRTCLAQCQC